MNSTSKRRDGAAAIALYAALTLALFYPALGGKVLAARDLIRLTYPYRWLAARIWAAGALPLWNAAAGMGMPLAADPIAGAFDPLTFFFALPFAPATSGTFLTAARFFLGGLFMFRYLAVTGRSRDAALLGGAAYILSGFSVGSWTLFQWTAALPYLPLALAAPWSGGRAAGRGVAAGSIFTLMLFGGTVEPLLMTMLFWMLELIFGRAEQPILERAVEAAAGVTSFVALAMMQILPTAELYALSNRAGGMGAREAFAYSVSLLQAIGHVFPTTFLPPDGGPVPGHIFTFAQPLFIGTYVGASVLPLAILGASRGRLRFAALAISAWTFAAGRYLPSLEALAVRFPILTILGFPVKILYLVPPSLAILAAGGADSLLDHAPRGRGVATRCIAIGAACLLIIGVVAAGIVHPDPTIPNAHLLIVDLTSTLTRASTHAMIALLAAAFVVIGSDQIGKRATLLLLAVVAADLGWAGRQALLFEQGAVLNREPALRAAMPEAWPRIITTSENDFRWGGPGTDHLHELMDVNSGMPWMVRHADEYCSFRMRRHERWWTRIVTAEPDLSARLFGSAGVRYFTGDGEAGATAREAGWTPVAERRGLELLANPRALGEVRFYAGEARPDTAALLEPGRPIAARLRLDGALAARFETSEPGWLYRAEGFFPGWSALDGDRALPVYPASDGIGQLVRIDRAGAIDLTMAYRPVLFFIGLAASSAAALACVLVLPALHERRRRR